jgi:ParB family chromosome partitioning protein
VVSWPTISNLGARLELPAEIPDAVRVGPLTTGHAQRLRGVSDQTQQSRIAREIIGRGLSVHATEALIKGPGEPVNHQTSPKEEAPPASEKTAHVQSIEDELRQKLAVRVEIRVKGTDRGQIVLGFESSDDFERLVEVLRR